MAMTKEEMDVEYKILRDSGIKDMGNNDADAFIHELKLAKKTMGYLKIATIITMVFGVGLMIILIGFILFGLGLFAFLKVRQQVAKYDYYIELAKNDPKLNHNH